MPYLSILATDIHADIDPSKDTPATLCRYIHLLLGVIHASISEDVPDPKYPSAVSICVLFRSSLDFVAQHGDIDDMIRLADETGELILSVDEDDGWPSDPWLYTLYCCTIAVKIGLQDPKNTGWPKAVSYTVLDLVSALPRLEKHRIMREMLEKAACQ